jgi:hypothetical protein
MLICPSSSFAKQAVPIEVCGGHTIYVTPADIKTVFLSVDVIPYATVILKVDSPLAQELGISKFQTKQKSEISILWCGDDLTVEYLDIESFIADKLSADPNFYPLQLLPR